MTFLDRARGPIAALAIAAGVACNSSTSLAPFQPEINNAPDNFQFQATGVTNVSTALTYTWQNSGTGASINQATTVTGGSATLTISDANGVQVYAQSLAANGTFSASPGMTGAWTIRVVLTGYSGTANFRVQKA